MDLWLRDEVKLPREWFKDQLWACRVSEANPLFAAALKRLLQAIDEPIDRDDRPCFQQIEQQLAEFPEVHWAAVPWSLATEDGLRVGDGRLYAGLAAFYPEGNGAPGFFDTRAYKLLSKDIEADGAKFYIPNPGFLYPALYDLVGRAQAAAKSVRAFRQMEQRGYRASLGGEREWLTLDRAQLSMNRCERSSTERSGRASLTGSRAGRRRANTWTPLER